MSLRDYIREATDLARYQWRAFVLAVVVLLAIYVASLTIPPGLATGLLIIPPCVVMLLTALARANDIGPEHMDWVWQVRRIGLVMAGAGAVMYMFSPWADGGVPVPWRAVILAYGVALAWLSTPILPPWWDYITGRYRETNNLRGHWGRFTGAGRKTGELDTTALKRTLRRGDGEGP